MLRIKKTTSKIRMFPCFIFLFADYPNDYPFYPAELKAEDKGNFAEPGKIRVKSGRPLSLRCNLGNCVSNSYRKVTWEFKVLLCLFIIHSSIYLCVHLSVYILKYLFVKTFIC